MEFFLGINFDVHWVVVLARKAADGIVKTDAKTVYVMNGHRSQPTYRQIYSLLLYRKEF